MNILTKEERLAYFGSVGPAKGDKPVEKEKMIDLQSNQKDYFFEIDQVGIDRFSYPVTVQSTLAPAVQQTTGSFKVTTSLDRWQKGINMSRIPELLHDLYETDSPMDFSTLREAAKELVQRMGQRGGTVQVSFPWYVEKVSPVSGKKGLSHVVVELTSSFDREKGVSETLGMEAYVATLCPCSKEISEYSAHNQRGKVRVTVELYEGAEPIPLKETLLEIIESNASASLYPILKRPDEKRVTEQAYENPRFVEDLIRLIAADLVESSWVEAFTIECRNEESIHLHDAYATFHYSKRRKEEGER